ncbi:MAG: Sec-independent protein translocase protein TatB [Alphaproteobacteria bacterium]
MPGFGWMELLIVAALAIVVVGPKDLPILMRTIGRFVGKARALAREFQESFEEIAREAELEELRKENEKLRALTSNVMSGMTSAIQPGPSAAAPMAAIVDEAKLRETTNAEVLAKDGAVKPAEALVQEPLAAGGVAGEEASNVTPLRGVHG